MKHLIELDRDRQIAIVRYKGEVRVDHAPDIIRSIVRNSDWTPRYSRIIDYSSGLLGEMDFTELNRIKSELVALIAQYYKGHPHYTAHLCHDPTKAPIVDYWVSAASGTGRYPAGQARFNTEAEAIHWIEKMRAAE